MLDLSAEELARLYETADDDLKREIIKNLQAIQKDQCEQSLLAFVRCFWPVVEPKTEMAEGRVLEEICNHLEAVTRWYETGGKEGCQNLLTNVPPGCSKSLITEVFWPAWEWGPKNLPQLRYVCSSYSEELTLRDNIRFATIIKSPLYQKFWGARFQIVKDTEGKISNTMMGWKQATSVGGLGTGERGDRFVCFPYDQTVFTDRGYIKIGDIVRDKIPIKVLSTDVLTGKTSWKPVTGWHENPGSDIVEVGLSDGAVIRCTPDHKIWTRNGWVEAKDLTSGDRLPDTPVFNAPYQPSADTIKRCKLFMRECGVKYLLNGLVCKLFRHTSSALSVVFFQERPCYIDPVSSGPNVGYRLSSYPVSGSQNIGGFFTFSNFNGFLCRKFCPRPFLQNRKGAVFFGITNILRSCTVGKIFKRVVGRIAIKVANIVVFRPWANKRLHHNDVNPERFCPAVFTRIKMRIPLSVRRGFHNLVWNGKKTIASLNRSSVASYASKVAGAVKPLVSRDRKPLFIRYVGHVDKTFCLSVAENHTFYVGGGRRHVLVTNCDDPHNIKDGESQAKRKSTLQWWTEVVPTRLNNPDVSSIIVIMQRVHENDVSGDIVSRGLDFVHLRLPMRFDPDFPYCETPFGGEWRTEKGELLWPERFSEGAVTKLENTMGQYATACNPYDAPILMADLSNKPIGAVRAGDELVGFTVDTGSGERRRSLTRCTVLRTFEHPLANVVKITLSSGRTLRCTPDHKWYAGKHGGNRGWRKDGTQDIRPLYRPAAVGGRLMRVCDPFLPTLNAVQERAAAWLAGFFDGEGSASNCEKRGQKRKDGTRYRPSCSINFYQSCEQNLPICDELEKNLGLLGFSYAVDQRKRNNPKWQKARQYRLRGICVDLYRKFLHVVRPIKWRERIIEGAYGAKFIVEEEVVVSIEPCGQETVYALETTTGNYVCWGLASSNSQLQQSPSPRGGGIIKDYWWQVYDEAYAQRLGTFDPKRDTKLRWPAMEFVVASLDTAYGQKQENDYSALCILGVWRDEYDLPKIMLMDSWKKRVSLHGDMPEREPGETDMEFLKRTREHWGLVEHVLFRCKRLKVDRLLIEDKTKGKDVSDELARLFSQSGLAIELVPARTDKIARLTSVEHLFSTSCVYAPETEWAETLIRNVANFPKVEHDDDCDALSQGLRWLRDTGWALRRDERDRDLEAQMSLENVQQHKPIYDL